MDIVETAWRVADEVLFPAALETDRSDIVSVDMLDALASERLYGLAAPAVLGGFDADFQTVCEVQEALASGCLTTAFVWAQHLGLVHALSEAGGDIAEEWLGRLATGEVRAGLALGGRLEQPTLRAREVRDGWVLDGTSPFVSGWGRIDVVHAAARTEEGDITWLIVDAVAGPSLRVDRLQLVALNATATVTAHFDGLFVPAGRLTMRHEAGGATPAEPIRLHAALALGVASRSLRLLGPSPLDEELAALRPQLDELGPDIAAARGVAGEFALRAASALMVETGSRSLLLASQAQRLAREALFTLVYALRPQSREAVSALLQKR